MVLTIANQKGGVGKTTTALNLAVCLSRRHRRVLVIDCDPQGTLTRQAGIDTRFLQLSLVDVLAGRATAPEAIIFDHPTGLSVLPAGRELAGVEMALVAQIGRERFLACALEEVIEGFDEVVIDTPPNLGLLTVNALVCADVVLAPVSAEDEASVQGLAELRSTIVQLQRLRGDTPELGVLITRWAAQRVMSIAIEQGVSTLGVPVLGRIPARVAVGHAAARRSPLALSAPDGPVTLAYERVAERLSGVNVR